MTGTEKRPAASALLRTLFFFAACVLLFEAGMVAVAPHLHSSSVLKLAKSAAMARMVFDDTSYYMAQGDLAARHSRQSLYQTVFFQHQVRFIYPPTALLFYRAWQQTARFGFRPIHAMNVTLWLALWATFGLAGEFLLAMAQGRTEWPWSMRERWLLRVLVALLGLVFLPLVNAYCLGQMQTLLNLAMIASALLWLRGQRTWPGVLLGLTCLIKPQMALFLLWGVLRRQWGFAVSLAAMLLAGGSLSIAVFGWRNSLEYLAVLHYLGRHGDALATNQSLNGLLHRLLHVGNFVTSAYGYPPYDARIYWLTLCGSAALLLAALVVPYRQGMAGSTLDLLLFAMAATMAPPIAWEHHYGVFFLVFLAWMPRASENWTAFVLLLGAYLLMTGTWAPLSYLMFTRWTFLLSHVFFGGLLLFLGTLRWGSGPLPPAMTQGRNQWVS